MRRPLLAMCFCMGFGVVLARYTDPGWWKLSLAVCCCAFVVRLVQKLTRRAIQRVEEMRIRRIAFVCVLFFAFGFLRMEAVEKNCGYLKEYAGQVAELEGVVCSARVKDGYSAVIVKVKGAPENFADCAVWNGVMDGKRAARFRGKREKVLVRLASEDVVYVCSLPGRECSFKGEISVPAGQRNPGCFDYAQYLRSRDINVICSVSEFRFDAGRVKQPVLNLLSAVKGKFYAAASEVMPEEDFAVLAGLLFGDRSFMDEESYEEFRSNGIAHVLAVSGLHVGMVCELIIKLMGGRRNLKATAAVTLSLLAYAALADFSVSVMRAAIMIVIRLLAMHLERRYDLVSAASLAAIVFMTGNPLQLFDSGFQLSFTAAYTMGICMPWARVKVQALADRFRSEVIEKLGNAVVPAVLIQLGMLPLTLYHFCLFSPLAILLNPVAIFLAGLILAAGLALFGVFLLLGGGLLFAGAAGPAQYLCRLLALLGSAGARAGAGFAAPAPPLAAVIVCYLLFFFFFSETRYVLCRRGRRSLTLSIALLLAVAGCLLPYAAGLTHSPLPWKYNSYPVVFLDVGQGDSIHISAGGKNILVDGGGKYGKDIAAQTLKPYLLKNGVSKVDLAIVTHSDGDHSRGIQQLSQLMEIDTIAFPCCYRGDEERLEPYITENRIFLGFGDEIRISDDVCLRVLAPEAGSAASDDENKNSLVMVLCCKDLKVLLTGDMDAGCELALLGKGVAAYDMLQNCDILKVAHHGSENSSSEAFIGAVSPSFAVISCGAFNSYGHPHKRVVDLLRKSDIIYGRSDECGAICLRSFSEKEIVLENAAKDRQWLIQREAGREGSTLQKP